MFIAIDYVIVVLFLVGRPHNPLINSGSILLCALHAPEISEAERINEVWLVYGFHCI